MNHLEKSWDENAKFWDQEMGEYGSDFHRELLYPNLFQYLDLKPGLRYLDLGCGNGHISRYLAKHKCEVVALDFSADIIELAKNYDSTGIEYHVLDVSQPFNLGKFDVVISNMVLMSVENILGLFKNVKHSLKKDSPFIFSVTHPCFNRSNLNFIKQTSVTDGEISTSRGVFVSQYKQDQKALVRGIRGQPTPHICYDRSLSSLLAPAFQEGFILDRLCEPSFQNDAPQEASMLGWKQVPEIPPALIVRLIGK